MDFYEFANWVHAPLTPDGRQMRLAETRRRLRDGLPVKPMLMRRGDELAAGLYLLRLPGNVSTLGGVRAEVGCESQAVDLLEQAAQREHDAGVVQVQAVVADDDVSTPGLLAQAGFHELTQVAHVYRAGLGVETSDAASPTAMAPASKIVWRPARALAEVRLASLVVDTFEQTLDCPELNNMRSPREVLDGFLDGRRLRSQEHWHVIEAGGRLAGCLFLTNQSHEQVVELSYMGLTPEFRQRGYGHSLMQRALSETRQLGAGILAAAVDFRNLPAMRLYDRYSFQRHVRLNVWLHALKP